MKVFYAAADPLDDRRRRVCAFVLARDPADAVRLLRQDGAFDECEMPPAELLEYGEDHEAIPRLAGAKSIIGRLCDRGVYPIRDIALIDR
jgi:hypothetical protein